MRVRLIRSQTTMDGIQSIILCQPWEVKEKWRPWVNQVPVICFNSSKYDLNIVKEYFMKEISYSKKNECNEDVFAVKKGNE